MHYSSLLYHLQIRTNMAPHLGAVFLEALQRERCGNNSYLGTGKTKRNGSTYLSYSSYFRRSTNDFLGFATHRYSCVAGEVRSWSLLQVTSSPNQLLANYFRIVWGKGGMGDCDTDTYNNTSTYRLSRVVSHDSHLVDARTQDVVLKCLAHETTRSICPPRIHALIYVPTCISHAFISPHHDNPGFNSTTQLVDNSTTQAIQYNTTG